MPVVLWDHEYKAQRLSDLGVLRAHSLKNWSTRCVVQTIYFSGKAGSWRFPPDCIALCQRFIVRVCFSLSYLFQCVCFLSCLVCRTFRWFFGFSEGLAPCVAVGASVEVQKHSVTILISPLKMPNFHQEIKKYTEK